MKRNTYATFPFLERAYALLVVLLLLSSGLAAQTIPFKPESSFKAGEELHYKLKYGILTAADAVLSVKNSELQFSAPHAFHLSAWGKTSNAFGVLFPVDNRYNSYIDSKTFLPYFYTENISEGRYRRTDVVRFDHRNRKVQGNKGTFDSSNSQTFDLLSAYYFARNLDLTQVKLGQSFKLSYFLNDEIATLGISYIGIETIQTALGPLECLKFSPELKPGRVFKKDSKMYLWVTNDGNRIPVRAQVEILVGSVYLELTKATGLKYPLGKPLP